MTSPTVPYPGLRRAGARLPLAEYTQRLRQRRWFVAAYSRASNAAGYERSFLGQAWQILTPLLNIGVYYLVFGLLLHTNRGVSNYMAFLSVGVFVFSFCQTSLVSGSQSITSNLGLIRALQFPRAVLPMSTTLVALLQLTYSLIAMLVIVLLTGEPLSLRRLVLVPAIALQSLFCLGLAFVVARIGAKIPDTAKLLPFIARVWMYVSGVMYSVQEFTQHRPEWVSAILTWDPAYVYLELARYALIAGSPISVGTWALAAAWGVGTVATGYLYFWRGEEEYGNA